MLNIIHALMILNYNNMFCQYYLYHESGVKTRKK